MNTHDVIAIGASAGGVQALRQVAASLPCDLPATVLVVVHLHATSPGVIADIVDEAGPLPARLARSGDRAERGRIYIAPPDHHLLLDNGMTLLLSKGPKENRSRPAIDPLFRSVALAAGARAIGVIMTGYLDDGAAGLMAIKRRGGCCVVQDPRDAEAPGMPRSALEAVQADHIVPLCEIGPLIARLAGESVRAAGPVTITPPHRL